MQDESLRVKQQWLCWSVIRFSAENVKSFMAVFHFIFLLAALMRIYFFNSPSQLWLARPISQPESSHQWAQHQTFLNLQIKWRWGRGRRVVRWTKTIKYLDDLNIYATFILVNPPDFSQETPFRLLIKVLHLFPNFKHFVKGACSRHEFPSYEKFWRKEACILLNLPLQSRGWSFNQDCASNMKSCCSVLAILFCCYS